MPTIIRALAGSGKPCHASICSGSGEWDSSDPEHTLMQSDSHQYWHSLILRTGSAGSFVAAPRDGSEREGINPEGLRDEDPEARTVVAVLFLSSPYFSYSSHFFIKFSVLREGVCLGTLGGHSPPAPLLLNLGWSNQDAVPQKEDRAGPET